MVMSGSDRITQDEHGTPLRWRSPGGVMHAVERTRSPGEKTFASRTRCGRVVDTAETWVGRDTLACNTCFDHEHEDRLRHDHAHGRAHGDASHGR
jgi:hypothetical protein